MSTNNGFVLETLFLRKYPGCSSIGNTLYLYDSVYIFFDQSYRMGKSSWASSQATRIRTTEFLKANTSVMRVVSVTKWRQRERSVLWRVRRAGVAPGRWYGQSDDPHPARSRYKRAGPRASSYRGPKPTTLTSSPRPGPPALRYIHSRATQLSVHNLLQLKFTASRTTEHS